jgi:hypothetical protein
VRTTRPSWRPRTDSVTIFDSRSTGASPAPHAKISAVLMLLGIVVPGGCGLALIAWWALDTTTPRRGRQAASPLTALAAQPGPGLCPETVGVPSTDSSGLPDT